MLKDSRLSTEVAVWETAVYFIDFSDRKWIPSHPTW